MNGKEKCELMKKIRDEIATKNHIAYKSEPCSFEGECLGYCPKCDSEAEFLDQELQKQVKNGKDISISGIADWLVESYTVENSNDWDSDREPVMGAYAPEPIMGDFIDINPKDSDKTVDDPTQIDYAGWVDDSDDEWF